uniref:Uncharacterized protein n=1 Tax=Oxyrrhis marina TaxID=2969 RepID=A7WQM4_OXYMA|nr:unknown [Oxyrrhis marina]
MKTSVGKTVSPQAEETPTLMTEDSKLAKVQSSRQMMAAHMGPHQKPQRTNPNLSKPEFSSMNDGTKVMQERAKAPPKHVDWKPQRHIFQPRQGPW